MTQDTYLKWSWVHGSLDVDGFESLEDAIGAAHYAEEQGIESFWLIEEVGAGVVDSDVVSARLRQMSERATAAFDSRQRPTHVIELRSPVKVEQRYGGPSYKWANLDTVWDGNPNDALDKAAQRHGADRVRVRKIS